VRFFKEDPIMRLNLMVIGLGGMLGYLAWQTPAYAGTDAGPTVSAPPSGDIFPDGVVIGDTCVGEVYVDGSTGYAFCDGGVWAYTVDEPIGYTNLDATDLDGGASDASDGGTDRDASAPDGGGDLDAASLDGALVPDAMIVNREPLDSGETADTSVSVDAGASTLGPKATPASSGGCSIEASDADGWPPVSARGCSASPPW
jgi:hypothetical protein